MCAITGCKNSKANQPKKRFFWAPTNESRRALWMFAAGTTFSPKSSFQVCEDHFDAHSDFVNRKSDVKPMLMRTVVPHLNLESGGNVSEARSSRHNIFHVHQSCQTEPEESTKTFTLVGCQTEAIDIEATAETKRKIVNMSTSTGMSLSTSISSSTGMSSESAGTP
ncbi:hypothetical protein Bhyg_03331 [Pseudolycoriella hygida]|uniref:THAP-type domain-containing protein n=1 Tax=Pseudolycoriella hygida TaxID=35572 RepID=A0A9Q0NEP5_9DIPT|nr:hypothetical protein Bhyg_03331 [Pseudolycoriella hygida]